MFRFVWHPRIIKSYWCFLCNQRVLCMFFFFVAVWKKNFPNGYLFFCVCLCYVCAWWSTINFMQWMLVVAQKNTQKEWNVNQNQIIVFICNHRMFFCLFWSSCLCFFCVYVCLWSCFCVCACPVTLRIIIGNQKV